MKEPKTNALRMFDRMKIPYETHAYQSDGFMDGVTVAGIIGKPGETVFKTLVGKGASGRILVFVIPVAKSLDLKRAALAAGEKSVAMLPAAEIMKETGYIKGGCSPVGMKKRYPVWLDSSAAGLREITVSAGRLGLQMTLSPDGLLRAAEGLFAALCAGE